MSAKLKLAVLISGSGTNLQAIIDSCKNNKIHAEIKIVISNKSSAYGLERAHQANIKTQIINYKNRDKNEVEQELIQIIDQEKIDLIVLAGFMKILSADFISHYPEKIINIHPSLLPAFPGIDAQTQAWEYGTKIAGCTVHFVDEGCDTGPIILQEHVIVDQNDTIDDLKSKILEKEHLILPKAIDLIASKKVAISGRKVKIHS